MKKNNFPKVFFGLLFFTIASFSVAGYATKRAQLANPEALKKLAQHYNISINDSEGNFYVTGSDDGNYEKNEKAWDLDGTMENLKVSTTSANVTFENSKDDKFHIFAEGLIDKSKGPDLFDIEFHDQDIFISDAGKKTKNVNLKIQVPAHRLRILQANSLGGDLLLLGIHSDQLRALTVSGLLQLKDVAIKSIDAKSTSGDIEIDNKIESNIDVKSISGTLKIKSQGLERSAFHLKSVSGEISNPFKDNLKDTDKGLTRVTADTISGDIKILVQ